jgi:hypothetical protein
MQSQTDKTSDGFDASAFAAKLILETTEADNIPKEPFNIGTAMISQKKLAKHTHDLKAVKEVLAELQIFVQNHNVKINKNLVDDIKLKVVMETLRNEMEARFDATFQRFEMA